MECSPIYSHIYIHVCILIYIYIHVLFICAYIYVCIYICICIFKKTAMCLHFKKKKRLDTKENMHDHGKSGAYFCLIVVVILQKSGKRPHNTSMGG